MINNRYPKITFGTDKICPVCGRLFIVYDPKEYVFKIRNKSNSNIICVCSWKCIRSYEEKHCGKMQARKKKIIEEQLQGIQGVR